MQFLIPFTLAAIVLAVHSAPSVRSNKPVTFGWLEDNIELEESYQKRDIKIGYAHSSGPELTLRLVIKNGTAKENLDYSVSPRLVTITGSRPAVVEVMALLDGLAMEGKESFTVVLEPVNSPLPDGIFIDSLTITLIDSDDLVVSLTNDRYRALESEGQLSLVLNKNKRLAAPLSVTVTPATVEQAMGWGDVVLPMIPVDMDPYQVFPSTTRASVEPNTLRDIENSPITVQFSADEDKPDNDLTVTIPVIDDELNEATEFFIVRLDVLENDQPQQPQTALCEIVDNDEMRIGFDRASHTFSRGDAYSFMQHSIKILSENNMTSEQRFTFEILVLSSSPSADIPPLGHNLLDWSVFHQRKFVKLLDNFQSEVTLDIYFEYNSLPAHQVAFELVIVSQQTPHLLPAQELHQSTFIII